MASITTNIRPTATRADSIADRLVAVLEAVAQLSPTYRRVEALSKISDAELAAQGQTRAQAAMSIFGARGGL